ncbi:hypothetical protein Gotur_003243 [Gossypium turneri]
MHRVIDLSQHEKSHKWPKVWGPFPHLVMALCKKANVSMDTNEQFIRFMQENGLVRQEFARQNGMRIPNLPPNKYDPMNFDHRSEDQESEEDDGSGENEEDEEEEEATEQDS